MSKPRSGEATPRRDFLRTLALAPAAAAAAGCATSHPIATPVGAPPAPPTVSGGAPTVDDAGLRAVRGVPLAMEVEPAFVFRAAPARPEE